MPPRKPVRGSSGQRGSVGLDRKLRDDPDDVVDAFEMRGSGLRMRGAPVGADHGDADTNDTGSESAIDDTEGVFDIRGGESSDDDDNDQDPIDDVDDDDEDDDEEQRPPQRGKPAPKRKVDIDEGLSDSEDDGGAVSLGRQLREGGWGTKRSEYYAGGEGDLDDDLAAEEEAAAVALQRARVADMDDADFALPNTSKRSGSARRPRSDSADDSAATGDQRARLAAALNTTTTTTTEAHARRDLSSLTPAERAALLESDAPELRALLEDFAASAADAAKRAQDLRDVAASTTTTTTSSVAGGSSVPGVPFLEARLQLLLTYTSHLAFYLLLRAEGQSARGHPVVRRLVQLRTLLDKARPLETRLRAQIDQLVRSASSSSSASRVADDRRRGRKTTTTDNADADTDAAADDNDNEVDEGEEDTLRPNPRLLVTDGAIATRKALRAERRGGDNSDDDDDDDDDDADGRNKYVAPRTTAVPYDAGKTGGAGAAAASRRAREEERAKERARKSRMLAELRAEAEDRPEEDDGDVLGAALAESDARSQKLARALEDRARERQEFEEEHFVRLPVTKAEKRARQRQAQDRLRFNPLGDLDSAAEIEAILRDEDAAALPTRAAAGVPGASSAATAARDARRDQMLGYERFARELQAAKARGVASKRARADDIEGANKRARDTGGIGGGADLSDEEDDVYARAERLAASRRQASETERTERRQGKEAAASSLVVEEATTDEQGRRAISREISTNRGLVKYRRKELRNPRVANRLKAERQQKRRKSAVPDARREGTQGYAGEATGVRTNIARSQKLG